MIRFTNWLKQTGLRSGFLKKTRKNPKKKLGCLQLESLEDRCVPTGIVTSYSVVQDWTSGYQAQLTLTNQTASPVNNWQLQFNLPANITSIWDATILTHTGNSYTIENAGWNSTLAAGGSISFGYNASPGGTDPQPTQYLLDGLPLASYGKTLPVLTVTSVTAMEPTSGTINATFTANLSAPSTTPVTVTYATANGTATAGVDYRSTSGTLTFPAGTTQESFSVSILADSGLKANANFLVNLSSPVGATLAQTQVTQILEPAVASTSPVASVHIDSDWGTGCTATITVNNTGTSTLTNWNLTFSYSGQISTIWNGSIVSHTGSTYVIQGASWNNGLAAGASTTFGFTSSPGNASPGEFSKFSLSNGSGSSTSGSGGSTGGGNTSKQPPVAVNAYGWTSTGQSTVIDVLAGDSDPNNSAISVTAVTQPANGTVSINSNGNLTYTPRTGFVGSDSFNYTITDTLGLSASASVNVTVSSVNTTNWPAHVFAPYVDMTDWPTYNIVNTTKTEGIKYYNLAFVVADSSNQPSWGGFSSYEINGGAFDQQMRTQIAGVRALGGDVAVSFGGENGQELSLAITSVPQLVQAYQTVINAYQLTHIDFDIEGGAVADHASIDRRSQALALLQQNAATAGRTLDISFTLPVLPSGLTSDGLYVLQSAVKYGVHVNLVNIMTMDFGDGAAPNPAGQMGTYTIDAAKSLFTQMEGVFGTAYSSSQLWHMIGITPLIGVNDVSDEVFRISDAQQVLAFAEQMGLGEIAMWSLNRDQQDPSGVLNYDSPTASGILQSPFQFSLLFNPFNG